MATLYFDEKKEVMRFVKQTLTARPGIVILAAGEVNIVCNMAGGNYYVTIGEVKEALVIRPMLINQKIAFQVTTNGLARLSLSVYTLQIARALETLRNCAYLHRLFWDFVGVPNRTIVDIETVVSVRQIPPLVAGQNPLRVCEGYFLGTRTVFFATPATRGLATVTRYRINRIDSDNVVAIIPDREHVA